MNHWCVVIIMEVVELVLYTVAMSSLVWSDDRWISSLIQEGNYLESCSKMMASLLLIVCAPIHRLHELSLKAHHLARYIPRFISSDSSLLFSVFIALGAFLIRNLPLLSHQPNFEHFILITLNYVCSFLPLAT